jgi:hypothetical protein
MYTRFQEMRLFQQEQNRLCHMSTKSVVFRDEVWVIYYCELLLTMIYEPTDLIVSSLEAVQVPQRRPTACVYQEMVKTAALDCSKRRGRFISILDSTTQFYCADITRCSSDTTMMSATFSPPDLGSPKKILARQ